MDSRPPNPLLLLLLLTSLLQCSQCDTIQSSFIIDAVDLIITPSSTVQSGTPVTVRCRVSVSHDNIPHLRHTFQLTQNDVPIHFSTTTDDSVAYELNPARAADSGNYECRVTVKDKKKPSSSQNLEVTGLQTPILYLNKTTLYDGDDLIATCSAPEEKGSLIFRFFQRYENEKPQKLKQVGPTGNSSETTLVLTQAGRNFLYCDYEIILVSGSRRSNYSDEIQVSVEEVNITPIMMVTPLTNVFEGDIIEVVCKVNTSLSNVEVFLTKESKILEKAPVSFSHRFRALEGDSGELACKAQWGNVQRETSKNLSVRELFSKPNLTVKPIELFEGDRLTLTCSVSEYIPERINMADMQFSIYKNNAKLVSSKTYTTTAQPNTNGNYTCKAKGSSGGLSFVKNSRTVVVKAKVLVSKPAMSVVGGVLVLGQPFRLLCHSDVGTLPITYTLQTPDRQSQSMVVRRPGQQAIFNCSSIFSISDVKKLHCMAKNSYSKPSMNGSVLYSTNIIEPVSKPVLTIVPNMSDVSEGQDRILTCSVERGSPPITFTWYHNRTKGALASQTSKTLKASYFIRNVKGEHEGGYYCMSTNLANITTQSYIVPIRVKLAAWKKGLIALFCILIVLILALVIAFIFKTRPLPFRRKRRNELSVKTASTKAELLSLTQAEANEAANVTPGMMGKSVWSEHVSGSESDDQNSVTPAEPQYTEVQTRQADPNRAPVKKGTDTVYSEVRSTKQGVPEQADGQGSVEYAQLNHDRDHDGDHGDQDDHGDLGDQGDHGDHSASVQDDHVNEADNSVDINPADHGE